MRIQRLKMTSLLLICAFWFIATAPPLQASDWPTWRHDAGRSAATDEQLPAEFEAALQKSKRAKAFFDQLAPSYRMQFIGWIATAKRPATRRSRG